MRLQVEDNFSSGVRFATVVEEFVEVAGGKAGEEAASKPKADPCGMTNTKRLASTPFDNLLLEGKNALGFDLSRFRIRDLG